MFSSDIKIQKGPTLTKHHIQSSEDARLILGRVYGSLPRREFDQSWKGKTGYMDGLANQHDFDCGEGFATTDDNGRRMVVLQGVAGPMVYFDRYGDMSGGVGCNGHTADLAPSWENGDHSYPYGGMADCDQLLEALIRRLP